MGKKGGRYSWFQEAAREDGPPAGGGGEAPRDDSAEGAGGSRSAGAAASAEGVPAWGRAVVPGAAQRRRRNRPKDPKALRNDPERMTAGARIPRRLRQRVEQALRDPDVTGEGETNFSLLVEALLERWLDEVGYGPDRR